MDARSLRRARCAHLAAALVVAVAVAGCALPPAALRGDNFAPVTPADASRGTMVVAPVRWGGIIAEVRPSQERTCFLIVSMPLDATARPIRGDESGGRFLACASGFYDPQVYPLDRMLTVVGWVSGSSPEKVGDYAYAAPIVEAYSVYLWPERPPYPYEWGPGPYWGWGPGFWMFGGPAWSPWGPYPYFYRRGVW